LRAKIRAGVTAAGLAVRPGTHPITPVMLGDARLATVCAELLEAIRVSTMLLHPVIPRATERVASEIGVSLAGDLSDALHTWPGLVEGSPIRVGEILFPRLDREAVLAAE